MARKKKDEEAKEKKELKRANGRGSVYKLSGRRRKPWIVVKSETDDKEVQHKTIIGYYETETEAKDVLAAVNVGVIVPKEGITLEEIYKEWLKTKEGKVSQVSLSSYKTAFSHLKKYHKNNFQDLRTAHLQEVIDGLHKKNMSKASMHNIKNLVSLIYDYAMQNDIVNKNYAKFISFPKTAKKEKKRFNDIEIQKLERLAPHSDMAQVLLVLIYTGFRIAELMELTKFSVDLSKKTITGGGKTEAGTNRTVPIHDKILPYIKEWVKREGYIAGIDNYPTFRNQFISFRDNNGFDKDLTIHCTRHTFASKLAEKGIDPIYIQKLMGHTNYNLTASVYTHIDSSVMLNEVNKI